MVLSFRFHSTLKQLTEDNENAQLCALQCVYELWSSHPQMLIVLVDKMLRMQIVECPSVINWIFSKEMADDFPM